MPTADQRAFLHLVGANRQSPRYKIIWNKSKGQVGGSSHAARAKSRISAAALNVENPASPIANPIDGDADRMIDWLWLTLLIDTRGLQHHVTYLAAIGIVIDRGPSGLKLIHHPETVDQAAAKEGLQFMQEMIRLAQVNHADEPIGTASVVFTNPGSVEGIKFIVSYLARLQLSSVAALESHHESLTVPLVQAGLASFGYDLEKHDAFFGGRVQVTTPADACSELLNSVDVKGAVVAVRRGGCMFVDKVSPRAASASVARGASILDVRSNHN